LNLASTETTTVETLATMSGGTVLVMIANHAIMNPATDNNGPGAPRTVIVDVSALSAFSSATQLTIDASTDPAQGPSATPITPAPRMMVTLNGYGVTFLQLLP
jgi:small neutral amino acid transporter SnatA (MarC family)